MSYSEKDIKELMNKAQPTVRAVAKNSAKGIREQLGLTEAAIEEAFVRGANWRLLQMNRKEREVQEQL